MRTSVGAPRGVSHTIGDVTFSVGPTATELFIGTLGHPSVTDWTMFLPGNDIAISGVENLNVALASEIFSFGFDFVEPENDPNGGGSISVDSVFD